MDLHGHRSPQVRQYILANREYEGDDFQKCAGVIWLLKERGVDKMLGLLEKAENEEEKQGSLEEYLSSLTERWKPSDESS